MKALAVALGLILLASAPTLAAAQAADAPLATGEEAVTTQAQTAKPAFEACAAVYTALARLQDNFGAEGSLLTERYPRFAKIDFNARLGVLAGQASKGVSQLKSESEDAEGDFFRKLIDAETEGDVDVDGVKDVAFVSNACDLQYGFAPSLGG